MGRTITNLLLIFILGVITYQFLLSEDYKQKINGLVNGNFINESSKNDTLVIETSVEVTESFSNKIEKKVKEKDTSNNSEYPTPKKTLEIGSNPKKYYYSYFNSDGSLAFEGKYSMGFPFFEGLAAIETSVESNCELRRSFAFIGLDGEIVLGPNKYWTWVLPSSCQTQGFCNGVVKVESCDSKNGFYSEKFINTKGEIVSENFSKDTSKIYNYFDESSAEIKFKEVSNNKEIGTLLESIKHRTPTIQDLRNGEEINNMLNESIWVKNKSNNIFQISEDRFVVTHGRSFVSIINLKGDKITEIHSIQPKNAYAIIKFAVLDIEKNELVVAGFAGANGKSFYYGEFNLDKL